MVLHFKTARFKRLLYRCAYHSHAFASIAGISPSEIHRLAGWNYSRWMLRYFGRPFGFRRSSFVKEHHLGAPLRLTSILHARQSFFS